MIEIPTLRTSRLVLRPWQITDTEALFAILQQEDILRYFPRTTPPPLEGVRRFILHHLAHWQEQGYGHWAVVSQEDQQLIGWNGLEYLTESGETEVAFLLSKSFWGQGLATEATLAALDFGFETVGLAEVIGLVHPENVASRRVLEKIGMTFTRQAAYFGMELWRYELRRPG